MHIIRVLRVNCFVCVCCFFVNMFDVQRSLSCNCGDDSNGVSVLGIGGELFCIEGHIRKSTVAKV